MVEYFKQVRELQFISEPDYERLRNVFEKGLADMAEPVDDVFDWHRPSIEKAQSKMNKWRENVVIMKYTNATTETNFWRYYFGHSLIWIGNIRDNYILE